MFDPGEASNTDDKAEGYLGLRRFLPAQAAILDPHESELSKDHLLEQTALLLSHMCAVRSRVAETTRWCRAGLSRRGWRQTCPKTDCRFLLGLRMLTKFGRQIDDWMASCAAVQVLAHLESWERHTAGATAGGNLRRRGIQERVPVNQLACSERLGQDVLLEAARHARLSPDEKRRRLNCTLELCS